MVANAANTAGITNFVHVSALNADPNSPSLYLKSKVSWLYCYNAYIVFQFEGEEAVRAICPSAVMVRPANMMGDEDRYLNYFACKYCTTESFDTSFCFFRFSQDNAVHTSFRTVISCLQTTSLCQS